MELPRSGFWATGFSALLAPFLRLIDKPAQPRYTGELQLAGLQQSVSVTFDRYAIPHVRAADESDLFFAQGYLHAQERLWQMELSRRFLSGRMAEIFGNWALPWRELSSHFRGHSTADFDYFVRLLGIRRAAEDSLALLPESDQFRLNSYCAGVNRYIEACGKKLPWEFRLLRHEPEPWLLEDSLTIGKGLAFLLSTSLYTRLNWIAIAAKLSHDPAKLRSLLPSYPDDGPTIATSTRRPGENFWRFTNDFFNASGCHPAGHGSNNWVVAPVRSASGGALLCNDPHLRMTLPSLWYLIHLSASGTNGSEGYDVYGASMAGLPCVQLGHNRHIAWGVTAALCDDVELYREKIHPLENQLYRAGHAWRKIEQRREFIAIRHDKPQERLVRATRHGPLISDFDGRAPLDEVVALRWTAHEPSQELHSVYRLNTARNWDEFQRGLAYHSAPSLNFVYADSEGNIGYALAGKLPKRRATPTLQPLSGWDEQNDWQGFIPFAELPRLYNPPSGIIATANNQIVDQAYPHYLSVFFEPPQRVRRIRQLLTAQSRLSAADMARIQLDQLSLHARELVDALRGDIETLCSDPGVVGTAAKRLLAWDGGCAESSIEAALFQVFHHHLLANLLIPELGEELFTAYVEILSQCITPTDNILREPASHWFSPRSRQQLVAQSLRQACAELSETLGRDLEKWRWGEIHRLLMNHSLGRLSVLKPLLALGPLPTGGDGMTINLGFYRHSNPYYQSVGAALRFIVDFAAGEESGFVLPSGQSGHPFSAHYADQLKLWRDGRRISLTQDPSQLGRCLVLKPC